MYYTSVTGALEQGRRLGKRGNVSRHAQRYVTMADRSVAGHPCIVQPSFHRPQ